MLVKLNATYLDYIYSFSANDRDPRYYLQGMCIVPAPEGGALAVATDGHAMCCWHDKHGEASEKVIVALSSQLLSMAAKNRTSCELVVTDDSLSLINNFGKEIYRAPGARDDWTHDHDYVDFYKVLPDVESLRPGWFGTFNMQLISRVIPKAQMIGRGKLVDGQFFGNGPITSHIWRSKWFEDGFVVIMPMRDDVLPALPTWAVAEQDRRKKEALQRKKAEESGDAASSETNPGT